MPPKDDVAFIEGADLSGPKGNVGLAYKRITTDTLAKREPKT